METDCSDYIRDGECWISSLSLSLPALETHSVHHPLEVGLVKRLREIDIIECPELVSLTFAIWSQMAIAESIFENLEVLDMFVMSVSSKPVL